MKKEFNINIDKLISSEAISSIKVNTKDLKKLRLMNINMILNALKYMEKLIILKQNDNQKRQRI